MAESHPVMSNPSRLGTPLGLYSHASRFKTQEFLMIAGQLALNHEGELVGEGDVASQIRQVFSNIQCILEDARASFHNVVTFTTYLTSADAIPVFMKVREELFATYYPNGGYPPNTLLVVSRLVRADCLVEISAVAAL